MTHVVQVLILGLLLGGVYALMASGLTLLFGVMRIVNLAHAVFVLVAAYLAYVVFSAFSIDPIVSLLITMPLMFGLGVGVYLLLFPRIETSPRYVEMTVLLTFGLALVVEGLLTFIFTGIFRSTRPSYVTDAILIGDLFIPTGQLYAMIVSLILLTSLWAFLQLTRTGRAIRATTQNRIAAQIVGVNVRRTSALAFGIGMALAGASGSLVSFLFPFFPAKHWQWWPCCWLSSSWEGWAASRGRSSERSCWRWRALSSATASAPPGRPSRSTWPSFSSFWYVPRACSAPS